MAFFYEDLVKTAILSLGSGSKNSACLTRKSISWSLSSSFPLIKQYSANSNAASGNAPGGRLPQTKDAVSDVGGPVSKIPAVGALSENGTNELGSKPAGFGMQGEDVKGSLKIHIKIDLEADIRVIAKVKGDIAIGLL